MKLKRFKERDNKRIGIIVFTIVCILLVSGVIIYRTFAIFEVRTNQNVIKGKVGDMGDIEFAFYKDDALVKEVPKKDEGYSLDTSSSYCIDMTTGKQISNVNWNDERWSIELKDITTTKTKCYLHFKKIYKETILNGAIPDLMNGRLVPVKIWEEKPTDIKYVEATGGKVTKADITDKWYSYTDKQWANAVILRDGKSDDYASGEEIPESDIESYFVWIPRYKYQLQDSEEKFNSYQTVTDLKNLSDASSVYSAMKETNTDGNKATNHGFVITFEGKDNTISTSLEQGTTIIHPAFTSFDSNGFWVAKFETGYNQNEDNSNVISTTSWSTQGAQKNKQASTKVIIKPNVYSWRGIQVANAFYTAYEYFRDLESHLMKNMEWGAVAYLTQSKYGRCNGNNTNCTEVRINNNSSYITGYSTEQEPTCGYTATSLSCNSYERSNDLLTLESGSIRSYYLKESQKSSTTGNYSGIYDMAGGAWEYVMGVMQAKDEVAIPTSGPNTTSNSGFNGPYSNDSSNGSKMDGKAWPSSKYYDLYDYNTSDITYQRGHLGDGTKEFGPFYQVSYNNGETVRHIGSYNADDSFFIDHGHPWFMRGGSYTNGTETGVGAFLRTYGSAATYASFRIVLTP